MNCDSSFWINSYVSLYVMFECGGKYILQIVIFYGKNNVAATNIIGEKNVICSM